MEGADSELPKLKSLASRVLETGSPDPAVLEEIASLAAAIAARSREAARRGVIEQVAAAARAIFPGAGDDLRSRLDRSPLDELSGLAALLDTATAAGSAFARADSGLMAARERGDYAAMAPLAVEADTQKSALTAAAAQFADRIGLGGSLKPDLKGAAAEAASGPAPRAEPQPAPQPQPLDEAGSAGVATAASPGETEDTPLELDMLAEPQQERRRLRALIRQIRPAADEAS